MAANGSQALFSEQAPRWLRDIPAVEVLRRVWVQQYSQVEGQLEWRANDNIPPASLLIASPYDAEARDAHQAADGLDRQQSACDGNL
jgi:hypothetical protein